MSENGVSPRPDRAAGANTAADVGAADFERYRQYLTLLARSQVLNAAMRDRLDLSGIVQQTFLEAHQRSKEFRDQGIGVAAWLRRILVHNLADALRSIGRAKRDAGRERSLDQELEHSSIRLGDLLTAVQPSPSHRLHGEERAVLLADALAELSEDQRDVVLLRHWHGKSLAETAAHLGRTPASVVGLLQRGLTVLRLRFAEHERRGLL